MVREKEDKKTYGEGSILRNAMKLAYLIDIVNNIVAKIIMGLVPFLVVVLIYHTFSRYFLGRSTPWAYDLTYMVYGTHFMLGAGYALQRAQHIGVDFLYQKLSPKWQAIVFLIMYFIVFFPGMYLFFTNSVGYAARSWALRETSYLSSWAPPLYPFKTVIPVSLGLLMVQGISEVIKSFYTIRMGEWPWTQQS